MIFFFIDKNTLNFNSTFYESNELQNNQVFKLVEGQKIILNDFWESALKIVRIGLENGAWKEEKINPQILDLHYADKSVLYDRFSLGEISEGDDVSDILFDMNRLDLSVGSSYKEFRFVVNIKDPSRPVNNDYYLGFKIYTQPSGYKSIYIGFFASAGSSSNYNLKKIYEYNVWINTNIDNEWYTYNATTHSLKFKNALLVGQISYQMSSKEIDDISNSLIPFGEIKYEDIGVIKPVSDTINIKNGRLEVNGLIDTYLGDFTYYEDGDTLHPPTTGLNEGDTYFDLTTNKAYIAASDTFYTRKPSEITVYKEGQPYQKVYSIRGKTNEPIPSWLNNKPFPFGSFELTSIPNRLTEDSTSMLPLYGNFNGSLWQRDNYSKGTDWMIRENNWHIPELIVDNHYIYNIDPWQDSEHAADIDRLFEVVFFDETSPESWHEFNPGTVKNGSIITNQNNGSRIWNKQKAKWLLM
jgi:hypothetical protein